MVRIFAPEFGLTAQAGAAMMQMNERDFNPAEMMPLGAKYDAEHT